MANTVNNATRPEFSQTQTQQVLHSVVGVEPVRALPDTVHASSYVKNLITSEDHTLKLCAHKLDLGAVRMIDQPLPDTHVTIFNHLQALC